MKMYFFKKKTKIDNLKIINLGHEKKCEKVKTGSEGAVTLGILLFWGALCLVRSLAHSVHASSLSFFCFVDSCTIIYIYIHIIAIFCLSDQLKSYIILLISLDLIFLLIFCLILR